MDIQTYIIDKALILIPFLYVIGLIIKASLVPDRYIPFILLVLSVIAANMLLGVSMSSTIQGTLIAGVTVLTNQLVKQTNK